MTRSVLSGEPQSAAAKASPKHPSVPARLCPMRCTVSIPTCLRGVKVTHVNQVWSTDITYIRLKHGFVYLTAIIDWYSRRIL